MLQKLSLRDMCLQHIYLTHMRKVRENPLYISSDWNIAIDYLTKKCYKMKIGHPTTIASLKDMCYHHIRKHDINSKNVQFVEQFFILQEMDIPHLITIVETSLGLDTLFGTAPTLTLTTDTSAATTANMTVPTAHIIDLRCITDISGGHTTVVIGRRSWRDDGVMSRRYHISRKITGPLNIDFS